MLRPCTEHKESSFAVAVNATKPQLRTNSVRWTRYLSVFTIYRLIRDIRTIYVRIRTLYKHIRLWKILYGCVRIRTYSVRILRTYNVRISLYSTYTYVFPLPKPVGTPYTYIRAYTYVYEQNTYAIRTLYVRSTYVYVRSTYVYW